MSSPGVGSGFVSVVKEGTVFEDGYFTWEIPHGTCDKKAHPMGRVWTLVLLHSDDSGNYPSDASMERNLDEVFLLSKPPFWSLCAPLIPIVWRKPAREIKSHVVCFALRGTSIR